MLLLFEAVSLVEFTYLVFTRMLGESYRRRLRSLLLCLCGLFRALINSLVGCFSCSLLFEHFNQVLFYFFLYLSSSTSFPLALITVLLGIVVSPVHIVSPGVFKTSAHNRR